MIDDLTGPSGRPPEDQTGDDQPPVPGKKKLGDHGAAPQPPPPEPATYPTPWRYESKGNAMMFQTGKIVAANGNCVFTGAFASKEVAERMIEAVNNAA